MIRINCIHYGKFCHCFHPDMPKALWIFKRECIELQSPDKCSLKALHPISEFITIGPQGTKVEAYRWPQLIANNKTYQLTKRYVRENFEKGIWEESNDMKEWTICEEIK